MKLNIFRLIVLILALAFPALAQQTEFQSEGLENRIDFWKKIYTQYGENDVIVHDRIHVNLIYDVVAKGEQTSKIALVREALDEIRANIETPEELSATAIQILDTINEYGLPVSASSVQDLRDNIHTQLGIKERFREGIVRSGRYLEAFQDIFDRAGLPTDIALLPLVESSFENRALSNAGAAGIWQFTRGTGRLYMTVGRKLDERLDPTKATRAAARLLRDNYNALGAWSLAITAYNHGRGGMMRAQNEVGSSDLSKVIDEYRGPLFGYASMNFYSEFLAAVEVYKSYEQYFGELTLDRPSAKPQTATAAAPAPKAKAVQTAKAAPADKYKVRKGDTLTEIAQRFGLTVRDLMDTNNLRNSVIHAGQILLVR